MYTYLLFIIGCDTKHTVVDVIFVMLMYDNTF